MMTTLSSAVEWWTSAYSSHATLRTIVSFAHVGGLLGGGGCAVAADRATLLVSAGDPAAKADHLIRISRVHRVVLWGLAALFVSGLLLLGADLDTYLTSRIFWLKMAFIAILLLNGSVLVRLERQARSNSSADWSRLYYASIVSLALWTLTTFLGAALPNIG